MYRVSHTTTSYEGELAGMVGDSDTCAPVLSRSEMAAFLQHDDRCDSGQVSIG